MTEENLLKHLASEKNPFRTPEGYFEGFTQKMMQRIKEEGEIKTEAKVVTPSIWRRWSTYAAAAVVAGFFVVAGTYFLNNDQEQSLFAASGQDAEVFSQEELDEAFDYELSYGLVDNSQIAYYLTEAY